MLWLNPSALFALASVAAPILIHILIQRKAERFPFPTLRFLQPTRLAAIRRHVLEDVVLLAVRIAILAAAVAALAGPLLITAARRQAWDRRVVRAVVIDQGAAGADAAEARALPLDGARGRPFDTAQGRQASDTDQVFETASLGDGIRRAILWLDTAPPARRELVIASPFPIGSITPADIAAIPADIGVRLERTGSLPATRTVPAGRVLTTGGVRAREVTLAGDRTTVRDTAVTGGAGSWPIDVVRPAAAQPAVDAAIHAVLSQQIWAAAPDHRARFVLVDPKAATVDGTGDASAIQWPWMADAVARIAGDPDERAVAMQVAGGLADPRFAKAPWQTLTAAADGRPLMVAAASPDRLIVLSAAPAADLATPLLLRAIANGIADVPNLQRAEVVPMADAVLQRWSRPSTPAASPRIDAIDQDDRRWLWLAVLCLLGLEMWIRRSRPVAAAQAAREEAARVA